MFNVEVVNCKAGNVIIKVDGKKFMNVLPPKKEYIQYLEKEEDFDTKVFIKLNIRNFASDEDDIIDEEDIEIIDVMYHPNEFISKLMHNSDFEVFVKEYPDCAIINEDYKHNTIPVYEVYIRNFSDPEIPIVAHIATMNFIDIDDEYIAKQFGCLFKDKITGGCYTVTIKHADGTVEKSDELLEEYNLDITFDE